jgi:hypothetical protein
MVQVDHEPAQQDPGPSLLFQQESHLPALVEVHQVRGMHSPTSSLRFAVRDWTLTLVLPFPQQTLYGGRGDEFQLTAIPTEAEIRSVVERCYEMDAGRSLFRPPPSET